jgi:PTS system sucrose-specific IIC component
VNNLPSYILINVIAMAVAFGLTYFFFKTEE